MKCLSAQFLQDILIWLVILGAVFAILRIVIPYALSALGTGGSVIAQILNIIMWAIIAIVVIYLAFMLIACIAPSVPFPR